MKGSKGLEVRTYACHVSAKSDPAKQPCQPGIHMTAVINHHTFPYLGTWVLRASIRADSNVLQPTSNTAARAGIPLLPPGVLVMQGCGHEGIAVWMQAQKGVGLGGGSPC